MEPFKGSAEVRPGASTAHHTALHCFVGIKLNSNSIYLFFSSSRLSGRDNTDNYLHASYHVPGTVLSVLTYEVLTQPTAIPILKI